MGADVAEPRKKREAAWSAIGDESHHDRESSRPPRRPPSRALATGLALLGHTLTSLTPNALRLASLSPYLSLPIYLCPSFSLSLPLSLPLSLASALISYVLRSHFLWHTFSFFSIPIFSPVSGFLLYFVFVFFLRCTAEFLQLKKTFATLSIMSCSTNIHEHVNNEMCILLTLHSYGICPVLSMPL